VHESSLSPCIHSILAARIGMLDKAYELYLRTSRLDLDDYNHEVDEGLHITSMAGSWMAIVEGFGGKRVRNGKLFLNPLIQEKWEKYSFRILLKDNPLQVTVTKEYVSLLYNGPESITVNVYGDDKKVLPNEILKIERAIHATYTGTIFC
jgi:maltose phosphorylase